MDVGEEVNVGVGVAVRKCAVEDVGMEEEAYKTKKEEEQVEVELGLAGVQVANRMIDLVTERKRERFPQMVEKKKANVYTKFPTLGPTLRLTGESASACFSRFFTDEVWEL